MTTKEIISLLRRGMFSDTLLRLAADTIEKLESENNRQKAEIENYSYNIKNLTADNMQLQTGITRLKSMNQAKLDMIHDLRAELETAKTEVVKKIIEHLEAEITISDKSVHKYNDSKDITYNNSLRETLRIVKEMAGER